MLATELVAVITFEVVPLLISPLKSLLMPHKVRDNTKLAELASVLTPGDAIFPPLTVLRIGNVPGVASSIPIVLPNLSGVQSLFLPDISCPMGCFPSKGK